MDEFAFDLTTDDGSINPEGVQSAITGLYVSILGRAPDPDGLDYWINDDVDGFNAAVEAGNDPEQVLAGIAESFRLNAAADSANPFSEDAQAVLSAESSEDVTSAQVSAFLNQWFQNVLGRDYDPEGADAGLDGAAQLTAALDDDSGADIGNVLVDLLSAVAGGDGDDAATVNNRIDAGVAFADGAAGTTATTDEIVTAASDLNGQVTADTDNPATLGASAAAGLSPSEGFDQSVNLDDLGGTQNSPAESDADNPEGSAVEFTDDVGTASFTDIANFGANDAVRFTGQIDGADVTAADVNVDPQGDNGAELSINANGTVSQIDLDGFTAGLGVSSVADLAALDGVGQILFGDEASDTPDEGDTPDDGDTPDEGDDAPSFNQTFDADQANGTQGSPATQDVAQDSFLIRDDAGTQSFVAVSGFGDDDGIEFTGVTAADVNVDPQGDNGAELSVNANGTASQIDLDGFTAGLGVSTVGAFNDLSVGDITFA